ncbi:MAG: hypothetical protein GF364_20095, partial [Candidatus Lokiarchaeota archaeon]|nr:hypothetical protein [Candidatus Lokiarchaeota archaeon]
MDSRSSSNQIKVGFLKLKTILDKSWTWIKNNATSLTFLIFLLLPTILWVSNDYKSQKFDQEAFGYDTSQWTEINDHPSNFSSSIQSEEFYLGEEAGTYSAARQMGIKDGDWIENNSQGYKGLIHVIINPHWDVDYMRSYSSNMQSGCRNIAEMLDFCRIYPDFTVTFDSMLFVKAFWENYPQYRREFLKYIKQGRIEIAQGSVSEFNLNGHDLESIARDITYGRNWVRKTLGVESNIAWLTDLLDPLTFAAGKLLKNAGYDYCYSSRDVITWDDEAYYWEFDNGQNMLFFHTEKYNNFPFQMEDFMLDFTTRIDNLQKQNIANKENILYTLSLDMLSALPWIDNYIDLWNNGNNGGMANLTGYRMVWSTPTRFFSALEHTSSIESVRHLSIDTADTKSRCSGTIASNSNYKIVDRAYEELLSKIETYGVFSALSTSNTEDGSTYNYNQDLLESSWWVKSIGHAHDTAVGVVSKKGNDAVMGRYLQGMPQLRREFEDSKKAFVGLNTGRCVLPDDVISSLGGQTQAQNLIDDNMLRSIAVCNKNAWNTTQPVLFGWNWSNTKKNLLVYDFQGNTVPVQKVPYLNSTQFDVYNDDGKGIMKGYLGYKPVYTPANPINREFQTFYEFNEENQDDISSISDIFKPDWTEYDDYYMFIADVPSVGYSYYYICENETSSSLPSNWEVPEGKLEQSEIWISNQYYNITFNQYGSATSIIKKSQASGFKEFVDGSNPIFDFSIQKTSENSDSKGAASSLNIDWKPEINGSENSEVSTELWLETGPVYVALHVSQDIYNSTY